VLRKVYPCSKFRSCFESLGEYLQSRKRTHRPGQTRNVLYVHLVAEGTIDERVYRALEARQDVIAAVLTSGR
jgi:SNF2 family DNA or RNA helicase